MVICVDLDGTLIKTDTLVESVLILVKKQPWLFFSIFFWLMKGRAQLKREVAKRVDLDVSVLPYNQEFLRNLKERHQEGQKLVLVTAADAKYAEAVADHLGIFSAVYATDGKTNLKGSEKLKEIVRTLGNHDFIYAGDSRADLKIWEKSKKAIVVNASPAVVKQAKKIGNVIQVYERSPDFFKLLLKEIRVYQWAKNLIVFVPLLASHRTFEVSILLKSIVTFFSFSFAASSVYLLNDLFDLEADRCHPSKSRRPFASGDFPIMVGVILFPVLLLLGLLLASWVSIDFLLTLIVYLTVTTLYSFSLKQVLLADVLCLAFLYTIRIFAGGQGASIPVSSWLLAFSMFFFFSLALVKRYSELDGLKRSGKRESKGRAYFVHDMELIASIGVACGSVAVLVGALYITSDDVLKLYSAPERLWFICPTILYWIVRVWFLAHRGQMHEDPVVFALKDKTSYFLGFLVLFFVSLAT